MEDSNRLFKILFSLGVIGAILVLVFSSVHAFEGFEVDAIPFYFNPDNYSQSYYQFTDSEYGSVTNGFYHSVNQTDQGREVGILTGFPVPYYSDGDHYSVFLNFAFSMPSAAFANGDWVGIYIRPLSSNVNLTPASGGSWLAVKVNNTTPSGSTGNTNLTQGSFTWQGYADCSYRMLVVSTVDAYGTQYIYNVSLVLDLHLIQGSTIASTTELRPFSVSAKYYMGYPSSSTTNYGLGLYKDYSIRCTDTSLYGLLQDIEFAVSQIDFSGLSGLATLSTTVENFYNSYTSVSSTIVNQLESIIDDGETDPDVTRWGEEASAFESKNNYLHELEESLEGTIEDFTFPEVANQTAVSNVVGNFFANEFVIALTLAMMALMIVFLIL